MHVFEHYLTMPLMLLYQVTWTCLQCILVYIGFDFVDIYFGPSLLLRLWTFFFGLMMIVLHTSLRFGFIFLLPPLSTFIISLQRPFAAYFVSTYRYSYYYCCSLKDRINYLLEVHLWWFWWMSMAVVVVVMV